MAAPLVSYLRRHHIGLVALCIALTGTAYAATLPRNSVGGAQLKKNAVTSPKVKKSSLLASDFRPGQLPAGPVGAVGPRGPEGPRGETGPKGETGTVDTSNFYDKAQSDARYLATTGKAADADKLDGLDSAAFLNQAGALTARINGPAVDPTDNFIAVRSYGAVSGTSAASPTLSSVESLSPATNLTARDLAMTYTNTAGAGSINVVLMVNGVDTDYRCAIAGPAESSCTNTGALPVPAGARLAFQVRQFATGAAGTNAGDVMVGIRLTSP